MLRRMMTGKRQTVLLSSIVGVIFAGFMIAKFTLAVVADIERGEIVSPLPRFILLLFLVVLLFGSILVIYSLITRGLESDPSVKALSRYGPPLQVLAEIDREFAEDERVSWIGPSGRVMRRFQRVMEARLPGHLLFTPSWLVYLRLDIDAFQCLRLSHISAVRLEVVADDEGDQGEVPEAGASDESFLVFVTDRFGEEIMLPIESADLADRIVTEVRLRASAP